MPLRLCIAPFGAGLEASLCSMGRYNTAARMDPNQETPLMHPQCQELKVIYNHLGFRNAHGRKWVVAPDTPLARGVFDSPVFWVCEQNRFSNEPLNSTSQHEFVHRAAMKRHRGDFGTWLVGDFSAMRGNGIYQGFCGNAAGPSFAIRDDVYCRILPECIRYFQVQSCGRDVPGWHAACHLDDGYIPEENRYIDARGGWHDAGDMRKWISSTVMIPISLLIGHRLWAGREGRLGLAEGLLLDESLQGVHYFLNMQDPATGAMYNNVGSGRDTFHDNLECRYTDNLPRSGDERRVSTRKITREAGKYTTVFAMWAAALKGRDDALADRCLAAARQSWAFDRSTESQRTTDLQWTAWGLLELYRCTGEAAFAEAGRAALARMLELQVTEFVGGQSLTRGFFWADPQRESFHHKHVGADYAIWVIAEYLHEWPDDENAERWREALAIWAEDYVEVFVKRNPFGLLPYSFYTAPSPENPAATYRPLGEGLYYRYFIFGHFGCNARSSLAAAALAATARELARPALLDHAYRLLEVTLGNNPFQLSTINGVGNYQCSALSFQMGDIPGGVTMGVGGDAEDMPNFDNPWHCHDEYYGYQTAQFLWAVLALEDMAW